MALTKKKAIGLHKKYIKIRMLTYIFGTVGYMVHTKRQLNDYLI